MINNNLTLEYNSFGEDMVLSFDMTTYGNGRLAIQVYDQDGPFAKITVNMPEVHLNEGEVLIKDWAENAAFVAHLVELGWLIPTGREVSSGFVFPMVARLGSPLAD